MNVGRLFWPSIRLCLRGAQYRDEEMRSVDLYACLEINGTTGRMGRWLPTKDESVVKENQGKGVCKWASRSRLWW
jgi:hypothetical protein